MSISSAQRGADRRLLGEELEQAQVAEDLVARRRALHLYHDAVAVLQPRTMHLADRPRRERLGVDALEDVLPRNLQLLFHHRDDLGLGERRHLVLQVGQLLDELGRKQAGTRGQDLAELGEGRPQLLERLAQPLGAFRRRERVALGALGEAVLADDRARS